MYGVDVVSKRVCQKWFAKFRCGDFNLDDAPRSGRPNESDSSDVEALVKQNPSYTVREMASTLNISHTTVENYLRKLGFISRLNVWVPHKLTEANLLTRVSTCDSLLKRQTNHPFLKQMVTSDEKWIVYDNVIRKRSWGQIGDPPKSSPKAGLHPKKIMLSVWWDFKGIIYYELLPYGQTINSDVYCSQLTKLNDAIHEKRPKLANRNGLVYQHDNARPHVSLVTRNKLLSLGWDVLPHPPYSPDLAPTDYHLFRSLQNSLNGKTFNNKESVKRHLDLFFASKSPEFYERGIMSLVERWKEVIDNIGEYIIH